MFWGPLAFMAPGGAAVAAAAVSFAGQRSTESVQFPFSSRSGNLQGNRG